MARFAIIDAGIVSNVVEAAPEFATAQGWVPAPANVAIGWTYNGSYTPAVVVTPVPETVTRRQAKLALLAAGLLADVEELIALADTATQIAWNDALEFKRSDPLVLAIGAQLGLTSEEIDDLFRAAAAYQ